VDADNSASASVVRDRLTWMVYSQLAIYGYFLYAFTPSVTLLRDDEHTSRAVSGLHGTGLAVGSMLTAYFAPRLIARWGRSRVMWAALTLIAIGVIVFVSCDVVAVTIAGALIAGFGGTLALNIGVAILTAHHRGAAGGAAVTQMNGLGSACGIFAPLLVGGAVSIGIGWRSGMLVTVALAIAVAAVFGRSPKDRGDMPAHVRTVREKGRLSLEFWRACVVLVMTNAIEFSMTIWSSDVLNHHDGLSKGTAATGVTAIVTGMTIGRLSSAGLTLRHGADALLMYAFGLTIIGFGIFWISTNPWIAFAGLFISGLGISVQFPLAITRAVGFSEGRRDLATAYAALAGGLAVGLAPFGLGALADRVGSHTAMLIVPAFAVLAVVGVATTRKGPLTHPVPVAVIGEVGVIGDVGGTLA
jgi:MFS family permease